MEYMEHSLSQKRYLDYYQIVFQHYLCSLEEKCHTEKFRGKIIMAVEALSSNEKMFTSMRFIYIFSYNFFSLHNYQDIELQKSPKYIFCMTFFL